MYLVNIIILTYDKLSNDRLNNNYKNIKNEDRLEEVIELIKKLSINI